MRRVGVKETYVFENRTIIGFQVSKISQKNGVCFGYRRLFLFGDYAGGCDIDYRDECYERI